jgi:hypothetical protein
LELEKRWIWSGFEPSMRGQILAIASLSPPQLNANPFLGDSGNVPGLSA